MGKFNRDVSNSVCHLVFVVNAVQSPGYPENCYIWVADKWFKVNLSWNNYSRIRIVIPCFLFICCQIDVVFQLSVVCLDFLLWRFLQKYSSWLLLALMATMCVFLPMVKQVQERHTLWRLIWWSIVRQQTAVSAYWNCIKFTFIFKQCKTTFMLLIFKCS